MAEKKRGNNTNIFQFKLKPPDVCTKSNFYGCYRPISPNNRNIVIRLIVIRVESQVTNAYQLLIYLAHKVSYVHP